MVRASGGVLGESDYDDAIAVGLPLDIQWIGAVWTSIADDWNVVGREGRKKCLNVFCWSMMSPIR
jgi:hypothetical protein